MYGFNQKKTIKSDSPASSGGIAFKIFFLGLLLMQPACKALLFEDDPANDPVSNFEALWKEVDEGYSFFEYKQIDWDSVYSAYRPQVHPGMSDLELFDLFSDMLYLLRDGHVNLISYFNFSRNWEWYLGYPPNFDEDLLERNYWDGEEWYTGPLIHTFLDSTIGYIRYPSFGGQISEYQLDLVIDRFKDAEGLVIDLRNNSGGSTDMVDLLVSRFADQKRLAYNYVIKTGPGHDDFSEPTPKYIAPEGPLQYTGPIVLLTNRMCYSATNSFVARMKCLPYVKVIGDRTGGGGGVPVSGELPNGWIVRYSATQTFLPDGTNTEGGIPPDIPVELTDEDRLNGVDTILERALEELKG